MKLYFKGEWGSKVMDCKLGTSICGMKWKNTRPYNITFSVEEFGRALFEDREVIRHRLKEWYESQVHGMLNHIVDDNKE